MSFCQSFDELPDFPDLTWVEADRRFIKNKDVRFVHQGIGEADALAVSFGESADELLPNMTDTAKLEGIFNLFGDAPGADSL